MVRIVRQRKFLEAIGEDNTLVACVGFRRHEDVH